MARTTGTKKATKKAKEKTIVVKLTPPSAVEPEIVDLKIDPPVEETAKKPVKKTKTTKAKKEKAARILFPAAGEINCSF